MRTKTAVFFPMVRRKQRELRVRAFLLAGIVFLGLDIFSQTWHAAVNRQQTWIWWASGIVLGALILALFALFEKRRNDVVRLLDDFRQWR
jgi:hypothetical protein